MKIKLLLPRSILFFSALLFLCNNSFAKRKLPESILKNKKENLYFTAVPFAAFSTDNGLGFGGRVYMYYNGSKDEELFRQTPYLHRFFVQYYKSLLGLENHIVDYDAPRIGGSLLFCLIIFSDIFSACSTVVLS